MMENLTEASAEVAKSTEDLSRELRQISDALWNAADLRNMTELERLLDRRQIVLEGLSQRDGLSDKVKRELLALQASDKYLQRQLDAELLSIGKRLTAVRCRKRAISGYKRGGTTNYLHRTG